MRRIRSWLLVSAGMALVAASLLYLALVAGLPDPGRSRGQVPAASTLITDRAGRLLYEIIDPLGSKHVPLPLGEIPLACRQATLATEDSRFYQHPGVDLLAIARTAWENRADLAATPGASTLTQQLARNLYLSETERVERSLRRKLREAWLAWRLEQRYNKDELLALYLNTTYYGHFAVGIEAAAQAYFGMSARQLDLAQCALLAGLPQYPAGYNPIENPDAARYRQRVVLGLMVKDGYLAQAQADQAFGERLLYASAPFTIAAPHFVMWVQSQLEAQLGPERLRAGGLRVTTTLDLDLQQRAEEIVARRLAQLRPCAVGAEPPLCDPQAAPGRRVDNAALVALDPATGAVLAMVGSPDYFDAGINGAVNAGLSLRQPGSAIKPLTYAAALDPERASRAGQQPWTASTLIADLRTVFTTAEGTPYVPMNYDLAYHGPVTVRTALANSYNIPAVKALQYVGVEALVELAGRMGIPWADDTGYWGLAIDGPKVTKEQSNTPYPIPNTSAARFGLALTLGGGEVRLLDLTAAYAAFANGGQRVTPFGISRVETLDGEGIRYSVLGNAQSPIPNAQYPLDPRVAYLITDILADNIARIPSFGEQSALRIGRPAAAKTGTTTDWRDNWTMGYTPDLATGVWVGNADNAAMLDVSGITGAGPIWHDFMTSALRDTPPRPFPRPNGLARVEVCADSGLLPSSIVSCPHRRYEWFIAGTEPTQVDNMRRRIAVDVRSGELADALTPPEFVVVETVWALPEEYSEWAREQGISQPIMDDRPRTGGPNASAVTGHPSSVTLASPDPNRVYRLDPGLPASAQRAPITAQVRGELAGDGAPVTLLLDGAIFAQVRGPDYTAWWPLAPGRHVWQAVATQIGGAPAISEPVIITVE